MDLLTEWHAERKHSRVRWPMLGSDLFWTHAHCLPYAERCRIHIEQARVLAIVPMTHVDTDRRKDVQLTHRHQKSAHADCWSILNVLHFNCILRDDGVVRRFCKELGKSLKDEVIRTSCL